MRIQDRIKSLSTVEDAYWDSHHNRLIVYYLGSLDEVKILVTNAIAKAGLLQSVNKITFIN
ncbi:hypothetical protein LCGC14_3074070 [marine sediment metagenome]|uniref:Uncharacterized protein n=1 Tax=marine sediment metagenome TaxID=412755 RepID=A0A0F8Z5X8_9ZZZZ